MCSGESQCVYECVYECVYVCVYARVSVCACACFLYIIYAGNVKINITYALVNVHVKNLFLNGG